MGSFPPFINDSEPESEGLVPLVQRLLANQQRGIAPSMPPVIAPPQQMAPPPTKRDSIKKFLGSFMYATGEALKAASGAPDQESAGLAAMGAGLNAPMELETFRQKQAQDDAYRQQQLAIQAQNAESTGLRADAQAQYQQAQMLKIVEMLGPEKLKALAAANASNAGAEEKRAKITLIPRQAALMDANAARALALALKDQYIKVGDKLLDVSDFKNLEKGQLITPIFVGDEKRYQITEDLAEAIGQPQMAGQIVTEKEFGAASRAASALTRTTTTGEGVISRNLATGDIKRLGSSVSGASVFPLQTMSPEGVPGSILLPRNSAPGQFFPSALGEGERTTINNLEASLNKLGVIRENFKPEWVGVGRELMASIAGRGVDLTNIPFLRKLGVTEEQAQFYATVTSYQNSRIKAITGAQMSEPEALRLKGEMPGITNTPGVFKARMASNQQTDQFLLRRMKALRELGFDVDRAMDDPSYKAPSALLSQLPADLKRPGDPGYRGSTSTPRRTTAPKTAEEYLSGQ